MHNCVIWARVSSREQREGYGITGERIRRKMKSGTVHEYVYYRCGNIAPASDHPVVRWREDKLEEAIERDLWTLRIPDDERRKWVEVQFSDLSKNEKLVREEQNRQARKRLAELEQMQQRLLDGFLAGAIEIDAFTVKNAEMKVEMERVRERLADTKPIGAEIGQRANVIFEFAQNAARDWRVSGKDQRRGILCRTLLKRSLSATSLVTTKKKPFDLLAEGRFLDESRYHST
jgi:hypothetical protein